MQTACLFPSVVMQIIKENSDDDFWTGSESKSQERVGLQEITTSVSRCWTNNHINVRMHAGRLITSVYACMLDD